MKRAMPTASTVEERTRAERVAQGLEPTITDPKLLAPVAAIVRRSQERDRGSKAAGSRPVRSAS